MSRKDPSLGEILTGWAYLVVFIIVLPFAFFAFVLKLIEVVFKVIIAVIEPVSKAVILMKLFLTTFQAERKRLRAERGLDKK